MMIGISIYLVSGIIMLLVLTFAAIAMLAKQHSVRLWDALIHLNTRSPIEKSDWLYVLAFVVLWPLGAIYGAYLLATEPEIFLNDFEMKMPE